MKKLSLTKEEADEYVSFLFNYRSFRMAQKIRTEVNAHRGKKVVVVAGLAHGTLIERFLTDRTLEEEYQKLISTFKPEWIFT
jgi:tetraacyldisaccharide-1-P 4'-kinase